MRRLPSVCAALGAVLVGGGLLAAPVAAQASDEPAPVDVIEVSGLLDPVLVDFISESIERAEDDDAQALVIQFNSRKAVIDDDELADLADELADAEVPIAIWVGPSGARAYEGSGQLVLVADVSGLSPGSRVGNFGDPIEASAITAAMSSTIEDFCCSSLGAAEAVEEGVVDLNAPVLGQFVVGLDGIEVDGVVLETARTVQSADGPRTEPNAAGALLQARPPPPAHAHRGEPARRLSPAHDRPRAAGVRVLRRGCRHRRRRRRPVPRARRVRARGAADTARGARPHPRLDARVRDRRADRGAPGVDGHRHRRVHRRLTAALRRPLAVLDHLAGGDRRACSSRCWPACPR